MYASRVTEASGRTLIIENDDGDRFVFAFPTAHVGDIHLEEPPVWSSGKAPEVADIWIDHARHLACEAARERGWLPHVA